MAAYFSLLAWESPGKNLGRGAWWGLSPRGCKTVRHDLATEEHVCYDRNIKQLRTLIRWDEPSVPSMRPILGDGSCRAHGNTGPGSTPAEATDYKAQRTELAVPPL